MNENTKAADAILNRELLGAVVESFGLSHQSLYIEFRDDMTDDHWLSIDTEISTNSLDFDCSNLSVEERALILFSRINLQRIVKIQCNDAGTLAIDFANNRSLIFSGMPTDKLCAEPWQVGKGNPAETQDHYLIIADHGGGYAIWDGSGAIT